MGTSGNRPGFKIFSINTTIRNPVRNENFLIAFQDFDGQVFDDKTFYKYLATLAANGIYKFAKMSESTKTKIDEGIELENWEVDELINDNPQACGLNGRVMTQFRALKDQGFLRFDSIKRGLNKITITQLGHALIDNNEYSTDVYCKAMIGLHANNPARQANHNEARPFLNTLFVINEVNKRWKDLGNDDTGIAKHEFGAFVLSMKDCDYLKAADEIIKYRKKYRFKINQSYLEDYCYNKLKLIEGKFENITDEYPDDVGRKFAMTGLLVKRGRSTFTFYDFSSYNIDKVNSILNRYKNYSFIKFNNQDEYYSFLESIELPWQESLEVRVNIAKNKAKQLGVKIDDYSNIVDVEEYLDNEFYSNVLTKAIDEAELNTLRNELLILSGSSSNKSIYDDIDEPLRLEYVLALILGKQYGKVGLISNIIYNEDGYPLHHAPSKRADLIYKYLNLAFVLEPTMAKSSAQMINTETTSVCDHLKSEEIKDKKEYRAMMIAPYVNSRVARFFRFEAIDEKMKIIPISIDAFVDIVDKSPKVNDFKKHFDFYLSTLTNNTPEFYTDSINAIKILNI